MAGSGGPWGGGNGDDDRNGEDRRPEDRRPEDRRPEDRRPEDRRPEDRRPVGQRPGAGSGIPEIDQIVKKGQEQLRVLMGGRGRSTNGGGTGSGGREPGAPLVSRGGLVFGGLAALALWGFMSFYSVKPEERSVELFLGEFSAIGDPGLNFAPWPLVKAEIVQVTGERTTDIGTGAAGALDTGLMLTRDQNIVDIEFQVVWKVSDPSQFLFNLSDPTDTIRAVAESAMRDIIARSELAPVLNRDRGVIASGLRTAVQTTLDSYEAGISVVRINFAKAAPPSEVINSFREVQAAQQARDRLEKEADAYANTVTAGARGDAARLGEEAEAYRAKVVNDAQGEASRFLAVYAEYVKAPEVTRKRMYLETMEKVLGGMKKVILDGVSGDAGQGVVPFLPLNELGTVPATTGAGAATGAATSGSN